MLKAYLHSRRGTLALLGLFTLIFAVVFALSRADLSAVLYGALLCLVAAALLCVRDFICFRDKHRVLGEIAARRVPTLEGLPTAGDRIEADYQFLLSALHHRLHEADAAQARRETDMLEYYTLWVHQIKTPISAAGLLLEEETPDKEALAFQLRRIEEYAGMALQYIRTESIQADLRIRSVDLDDMVRQAVRSHAKTFIAGGTKLSFSETGVPVLTDEKWLVFVLEQLLSNALKYTRQGEIFITLEPPKTLVIRDTGPGIAADDLPRIFERGFTGYRGREDKRSTGLGLFLCHKIMTRLGHGIRIESAPGEGTAVYLDLDTGPGVWE